MLLRILYAICLPLRARRVFLTMTSRVFLFAEVLALPGLLFEPVILASWVPSAAVSDWRYGARIQCYSDHRWSLRATHSAGKYCSHRHHLFSETGGRWSLTKHYVLAQTVQRASCRRYATPTALNLCEHLNRQEVGESLSTLREKLADAEDACVYTKAEV